MFFPFFSLYLTENAGLSGTAVGLTAAVLPMVGLIAQPFWGIVADRTGSRQKILVLLAIGIATGYALLPFPSTILGIVAVTAMLGFFSTAAMPMATSVSLAALREVGPGAFGWVRTFGTVGFFVFVVSFPTLLDAVQEWQGWVPVEGGPSEPGLHIMFWCAGTLVGLGAIAALMIPYSGGLVLRAERGEWRSLLRHRPYVRLLIFIFTAWVFIDGPMWLFPTFVRARGGDLDDVSRMWILMLLLEVPLVAFSGVIVDRIGTRAFLGMGLLAGSLRWVLCGLSSELWVLYATSILHGISVAGLIVGSPYYVEAAVPEQLRSTGQGVLAMLGISAGGIVSRISAGWLLEVWGPSAPYLIGGIGGIALACAIPLLLPVPHRPETA